MCLAVPMKVLDVNGDFGTVELGGVRRTVDVSMVAPVAQGQYVIVHAGFALAVMDELEAEKTLTLLDELARKVAARGEVADS